MMRWNRRYLVKSYISGSLWLVPFVALVAFVVVGRMTANIGSWLERAGLIDEANGFYNVSVAGARTMLETVATLNLSFIVFTFGSLLVAIQVAGGQYTPRIIATTLLRDNAIRITVGYFVFTLLAAVRLRARMSDEAVRQFETFVVALLGLVSIVMFLYLIDYAARLLRPVSLAKRVGEYGIGVIRGVYPKSNLHKSAGQSSRKLGSPDRVVAHAGTSGIVLAVNLTGLVARARQAGGVIEFVPQVGDFVAVDEPLFHLYGGAKGIEDRHLLAAVALGSERTMDQDPSFSFRILVDMAIKALSPAINDPTTAVLCIDQLHRLLRLVGQRHVGGEEFRDEAGELRLVYRTPNWEDFVHLTCTEIRQFGAGSVQVMRRLRSMLENLMQTLPPHRHAELRQQLELLDRAIDARYAFPEDRAIARIADSQGLGGALGMKAAPAVPPAEGDGRQK
jgi:uncharacterized membrane protein